MSKEHFETHKSNSEALSDYIAYYYFNSSVEEGYTKRFLFYPHFRNALTVYKGSRITFGPNRSAVEPYFGKAYEIIYTGMQEFCRYGQIKAPFDKIGVVFHALGINHFIDVPLSKLISKEPRGDFNPFGPDFVKVLDEVYATTEIEAKVDILDNFFRSRLRTDLDPRLKEAVASMFGQDGLVSELASEMSISRKTLQRLFNTHLNCSPKTYYNIIKFRRAIDLYHEKRSSMTNLAYENAYYDQSDFIKHFRKVTGFNPKRFFNSLSHLGGEDTFWTEVQGKDAVPFLQF